MDLMCRRFRRAFFESDDGLVVGFFNLFLVVSKRYTGILVTGLFAFVPEEKDEKKIYYFHKSGTGEPKTTANRQPPTFSAERKLVSVPT